MSWGDIASTVSLSFFKRSNVMFSASVEISLMVIPSGSSPPAISHIREILLREPELFFQIGRNTSHRTILTVY